jgi:hypothetical protein
MQQQHAISYVTTIRNRFANEPGACIPLASLGPLTTSH